MDDCRNLVRLLVLVVALGLGSCSPAIASDQIQSMVRTSVAGTVEAQSQIGTAVALTLTALAPAATTTVRPLTATPETAPSATGVSAGGLIAGPTRTARHAPDYACDVKTRPFDRTAFKPGDAFDIKWTITNTGAKTWPAGKGLEYMSGPQLTNHAGVELPKMEPGDTFSFTADANAPLEKGFYVMSWKVEGGFCFPYVAIVSGRPGDP